MKYLSDNVTVYLRLLRIIKPYAWVLALGMVATLCGSGVDSGLAWLIKPLIDKGFIEKNRAFIDLVPLVVVVIFALRGLASFLSNYCVSRVGRLLVMDVRQKLFAHYLCLPASFFDQCTQGQLLSTLIYNTEQIAQGSTTALLTLLRESFFAFGLLTVMFMLNAQLSLLFIVSAPLIAWVFKKSSRRMRSLSHNVQEAMGEVTHVAEEAIEGYRVIRSFGGQGEEIKRFNKAAMANRQRELKIVITDSLGNLAVQCVLALPIAFILYLVTSGHFQITTGAFAAFITAVLSLRRPLRRLTRVNNLIQKGVAAADSIFNVLDEPMEIDTGVKVPPRITGQVYFEHVNFKYTNKQSTTIALNDINLKIEAGQRVALVGHSGSGKTTLISLLLRFYEVDTGCIAIDGIPINAIKLSELRKHCAFVSQEVVLFNTSIAENISYGTAQPNRDRIIEAAKAANAWSFIEALPDGLDTRIGENGGLLSGGQRQRLAIARALFKDAPILILDEATSALDTSSEQSIQVALDRLMRNRTTLVIAHRLSTIKHADCIVVLEKGRIVERGTHSNLIARNGAYARLYNKTEQPA